MLAVLLVTAFYMIVFIGSGPNLAGTLAGLVFSMILFAPMIFLLAPLFAVYLLCVAQQKNVFPDSSIYAATIVCLVLQYVWPGFLGGH